MLPLRKIATVLAATLYLLQLTACAKDKNQPLQVVRLGYFPNVTHAQAVIGVARGDFQQAIGSLKLEPVTFNAGPGVIEAIYAGHLDVAYVGPSPIINGFIQSEGEEVRVIAGSALNGVLVVGNKARGISSLDQLRGKTIASPQLGNTQDISAKTFVVEHLKSSLKQRGGETDVVPMPNPDIELLFSKGQLDAAWVPEPWGSRLIQKKLGVLLAEEKNFWPQKQFSLTNVIARREFLEKHPDVVRKLLQAHIKLTQEFQTSPTRFADPLNKELKRLTSKDLPPAVMQSALKYTQFTVDPSPESLKEFYRMGHELHLVRGNGLDLNRLLDTRIIEELRTTGTRQLTSAQAQEQPTAR